MLEAALRHVGFEVDPAATGREALDAVGAVRPDLIVLDVMLPDLDGFEVCRRLRAEGSRTPVLFLTARDATDDKVRGLTLGGDDYLVKPFSLEELVARVRPCCGAPGVAQPTPVLRCADLEMDDDAHRVTAAGDEVSLSPTEYKLLRYLLVNQGRVAVEGADPRPRVAVRLRRRRRRRRDLHRLPAPQGRRRPSHAHPHDPGRRLHAARACRGSVRCRCAPVCSSAMALIAVVLVVAAVVDHPHDRAQPGRPGRRPARARPTTPLGAALDRGRGPPGGRRRPAPLSSLYIGVRRRRRRVIDDASRPNLSGEDPPLPDVPVDERPRRPRRPLEPFTVGSSTATSATACSRPARRRALTASWSSPCRSTTSTPPSTGSSRVEVVGDASPSLAVARRWSPTGCSASACVR